MLRLLKNLKSCLIIFIMLIFNLIVNVIYKVRSGARAYKIHGRGSIPGDIDIETPFSYISDIRSEQNMGLPTGKLYLMNLVVILTPPETFTDKMRKNLLG